MHFEGCFVYNIRPMRADFYLTLHCGLLATALYQSCDTHAPVRAGGWTVPAAVVLRDPGCAGQATLTAVSPATANAPRGELSESGLESSATPVCGYRRKMYA